MNGFLMSMLVAATLIFIIANYLFIDSAFIKNKVDFSLKNIRLAYATVLTAVFAKTGVSFLGALVYFSLLAIYILRISEIARKAMPGQVVVGHSHEPYYYLSLYWSYFVVLSVKFMVSLLPAIGLLFLASLV